MKTAELLDVIERVHTVANHPDIVGIRRYGRDVEPGGQSPAGVALTYKSGSEAYLWHAAPGNPAPTPADLPAELPGRKIRAPHALKFLVDLLDTARPDVFKAWRTVDFAGVAASPSGLEIRCTDGSTVYLRVTAAYGGRADLDEQAEHDDYVIPEEVRSCLRGADAASAGGS